MNKKIFRANVAVALLVLLASIVLIMGILFQYFESQLQNELASEADYIAYAVENQGIDYIYEFRSGSKRISLISPDGTVLADTSVDQSDLDNHADRQEVREAVNYGRGTSIRYSHTLAEKTVYYALRMDNGNILRVSTTQYTVIAIILKLIQPIMIVVLIALALSSFLAHKVSKAIIKPINQLDLEHPANNEPYDELAPLLQKIVKQKRTIEKQVKEAEYKQEEFRAITETMQEGFIVVDQRSNLLTYNRSALQLLGVDRYRLEGMLSDPKDQLFAAVNKALAGEREKCELAVHDRDYRLIANPVFEQSEVIGVVIMMIDVTESVKREQLRREFTANVSHELKTPLTSISGFAEMMKSGNTPDSLVVDFSSSIYDEAQRLITLVNDIMKISELDEKELPADSEAVDLYELSANVLNRLKPIAEKRNIHLNMTGESTVINGSRKILDELIDNLCDNAIKYNVDNGSVELIVKENDTAVELTVKDTGIGIPQPEQERIFERFYRVDKSHSKSIGGTGLGLSIVKHAANYHHADIQLSSEPGKGTAITVTFNKSKQS